MNNLKERLETIEETVNKNKIEKAKLEERLKSLEEDKKKIKEELKQLGIEKEEDLEKQLIDQEMELEMKIQEIEGILGL